MVIIGVDPHPDSHTLVALDHNGAVLDSLIVGNSFEELHELKSWAASYPQRCWAIEGAGNRFIAPWVACLLAQKERVVNISANLTSQSRRKTT
jgi:transposase